MKIFLISIKKFLVHKIKRIKKRWNNKIRYLEAYIEEKDFSQTKFDDLAPKDDVKKCEKYCESIEWSIENKKVFNVALTGSYGAGKSSILRTFEKNYKKYKYLNISLASFYEKNQSDTDNEANKLDNKSIDVEIEKGILQQLFYKVDSRRIPYTRFRKIKNIKTRDIFKNIILISMTIILALCIFKINTIKNLINFNSNLKSYIKNYHVVIAIYVCFIWFLIYNTVNMIKYFKSRVKLSTLKFEQIQLDIDKQNSDSIFNQYLDEILYFFEVTKYNVVMIEDLDRFNNTRIFTKLRELNQLINNYEKINKKVVFIYAIKDDMFKNDERTKFFDFIIPVIPVINQVNSGDILLEKIKQDSLGNDISEDFINGVSVYIKDMRMLTNIYNEYRIYKSILDEISLKDEKILALVIYKNLYPSDFSQLQYNRGLVYESFKCKKEFIKNKVEGLNNEISSLQLTMKYVENECLSNIRELKVVFLYWISEIYGSIDKIDNYSKSDFLNDDFDINQIFSKDYIEYSESYYISKRIEIKEIDKKTSLKLTFKERFENIKYKTEENKEELKNRIEKLKNEIRKLKALKLKERIKTFGVENSIKEEILKEKLIVYLLRHGFIDETYTNYLTYFYENNITIQDMNFILGVRNYEEQSFDYELNKIDGVIYKLSKYEFEQKEILSFKLLEFLLQNKEKYSSQLEMLINQLSDESEISVNFIDEFKEYIDDKQEECKFWNIICKAWNNLWHCINNYYNYPKDKIDEYMYKILKYVDIDIIDKLNIDNDLVKYIENNKEFFVVVSQVENTKIKDLINKFNIKFNVIEIDNTNEELLNYIWDGCFYKINKKIIQDLLIVKCNKDINNINNKNFTTIKNSDYENLIKYIEENIYEYVNNIFLNIEENVYEDTTYIIQLLNIDTDKLNKDIKLKIIYKEEFELLNLEYIPKELWEEVLRSLRLVSSWENVLKYYNYFKSLDDTLIKYLNNEKVYNQLSLSECEQDEIYDKLFENIIESEKIENSSFENLIKSMQWIYTDYDISKISYDHMEILIEQNKFEFNVKTYESIRENFNDIHIKFIENNIKEYIKNIDDYNTDDKDLYKIIKLSVCTIEYKKVIISKINKDLFNRNILLNQDLRNIVYKIAIDNRFNIGIDLYREIFENSHIQELKIKILSNQSSFLSEEDIKQSLDEIGGQFSKISISRTREKIPYSEEILQLAKSLEACNYISSYTKKDKEKVIQFNQYNKDKLQ